MSELAPKLRFPEFKEQWRQTSIGEVSETVTSGARDWAQYYSDAGAKFIRMTNLSRNGIKLLLDDLKYVALPKNGLERDRTSLQPDDILISITAELGKIGIVPDGFGEAYINQHTGLVRPDPRDIEPYFLAFLLSTKESNKKLNQLNDAGAKAGLNLPSIKNFPFHSPPLKEQQKIASFLSAVDEKIRLLERRLELLQTYKRGVMQKLFSKELRFNREDGSAFPDWELIAFGDIFTRVTRKNKEGNQNVMTISAQQGLINQEKFFSKSVAAKDVSQYYLLEKGEFAYNKSYSHGYPMGAIKRLWRYDKGVVSTLYICFKAKNELENAFFEQYFDGGFLNHEIAKIAQEGARNHGLLNISVSEFFRDIFVNRPSLEEQQKIADFLSAINSKLSAMSAQLSHMQHFKKGLLQQMFI